MKAPRRQALTLALALPLTCGLQSLCDRTAHAQEARTQLPRVPSVSQSTTADTAAAALTPPPPATVVSPDASGLSFTLGDALTAFRRGHPLVAAAASTVRAASADVVSAGLWSNPTLSALYTRSVTYTSYDPILGYGQLAYSQFLELSGAPDARRRAAEQTRAAAQSDADNVLQTLAFAVHSAFVALAAATARREVYRDTVARLEQADQIVRARVAAGATPHYDASRISVALADARAGFADAEADIIRARADLDVAVGPGATTLRGVPRMDLSSPIEVPTLASLLAGVPSRPDVAALHARALAAATQIDVARRSVAPGMAITFGVGLGGGIGPNGERQIDLSAGIAVPLAIVDRGQGAIPAATARARAASDLSDAVAQSAEQRVRAAFTEMLRRREALARYAATGAADSVGMRREAEAGYREGRLSILDLVDAYQSVRDARLRLVSLSADTRNAEVLVLRSAGVLPASAN